MSEQNSLDTLDVIARNLGYVSPWHKIQVGVSHRGSVEWDVEQSSHVFVTGDSGRGKSVFLRNVIQHCISHKNKWDVYVFDVNVKNVELCEDLSENIQSVDNNYSTVLKTLSYIERIVDQRFISGRVSGKRILFIVHEADFALPVDNEAGNQVGDVARIMELTKRLMKLGNKVGVHVIVVSNKFNEHVVNLIDECDAIVDFGELEDGLPAGRGIFCSSARGEVAFQGFMLSEESLSKWIIGTKNVNVVN